MLNLKRPDLERKTPYIVGHRGAKAHSPENTLLSFKTGAALGADFVECDVHLSLDGEVIVIHDSTTERTTHKKGFISQMTLTEIQCLDAGKGEKIPTLAELLDWLKGEKNLKIAVEIKEGIQTYPKIIEKTVQLILERDLLERVVLISFDESTIFQSKQSYPNLAAGILYYHPAPDFNPVQWALKLGADVIGPCIDDLSHEVVKSAHRHDLGVFTWTANSAPQIRKAIDMGADAIASDAPDRIRQFLDRQTQS